MTIDFEPDETEQAICDALTALCKQHCPESVARADPGVFPTALWSALAEFGFFALGTPEGIGGAVEIAAAGEVLGSFVAPGPLAAAVFAIQALPEEERGRVSTGEAIVSLGAPPLMPWPDHAHIFLGVSGGEVRGFNKVGEARPAPVPGGEPWAYMELAPANLVGPAGRAWAFRDVFLAAYLVGAADRLVRSTAEYVASRRQFGRTLAQFQAISHPLAECAIRLGGARALSRLAAHELDLAAANAPASAATARISAENAALMSMYVCHQSHGAMGMTADGPVGYVSQRVRQLVNQQGADAHGVMDIERAYLGESLPSLKVLAR